MPELADVEGFRRTLARYAAGHRIEHVRVPGPDLLRNTSPQGLGKALRERAFDKPTRHGKWLIAPADGHVVLFHFGMTGGLHWTSHPEEPLGPHDRVVLEMDHGELRYHCQRKFGGVWLLSDPEEMEEITGPLGPDAARIDEETFFARLRDRRGRIKPTLMDQELLAGIGNELSDEILWRVQIHPRKLVGDLSEKELNRLYAGMREILQESMKHGRIPRESGWFQEVRDQERPVCPRCGARVRAGQVGGRTARWCPRCQKV